MLDRLAPLTAWLDRWGRLPVFGVVLAVAGALLVLTSGLPTARENEMLRVRAEKAEAAARAAPAAAAGSVVRQEEFDAFFARPERETDWLNKIHALATAQGIAINQATYSATAEPTLKLVRYQVTLPVQGTYPQVRRFAGSLLNEIPVLALESVTFERKQPTDRLVDAQLKLTLFLPADR